ncbi:MAG: hypothetical protein J6C96_11810 [Oscillospiraceae bacterium]|nr:hypothetical protein [Oscillospiraceae bacterium]
MKEFTLSADKIYTISKRAFFTLLPNCEASVVRDCSQWHFNLGSIAKDGEKKQRIEIIALIIVSSPEEQVKKVKEWLTNYFSLKMQKDLFDLEINDFSEIIPGRRLERAINRLNRKR